MWYLIINIAIGIWVFFDARKRKMETPILWAIGTCLMMVVVVPFYFAKRSLMVGEVREGGTSWNVLKSFAILWTLLMFATGVSGLFAAANTVNTAGSGAEQTGAAIGTAIGMGMILGLWIVVLVGVLAFGLFLKKASVVENGPTGALATLTQPLAL
jgi:hypothetical protein